MLWLLLVGIILLCVLFTAFEKWSWMTLSILVTGGLYFWTNKTEVIHWMTGNWQSILCFAGAYIIAGVIWSFGKWFFFLIGFRDAFRDRRSWYFRIRGLNPDGQLPENFVGDFQEFLKRGYINDRGNTAQYFGEYGSWYYGCPWYRKPRASEHKSRITGWVGFWPFSVVGTMINDPLRKLIDFIFTWFKGLYQRMSNFVFRNEVGLD